MKNDTDQDLPAPGEGRKVPMGLITVTLLILVGGGLVMGFIPRMKQKEATKNDTSELAITTVSLISPQPGKPEEGVILPAEVEPILQASIYARVGGYLKKWQADIGSRVKGGDTLAEIDTPETDRALDQARAELGVAKVNAELAATTDTRSQGLLKIAAVSKQDAEEKAAAVNVAKATVEAQEANVRRLEETQGFKNVVAPFDGIITVRNVDVGDLITSGGGRELFHIAQTQKLRIYVRVPQTQAAGIVAGQTAELLVPEYPDKKFEAKVVTTSEAISATSRTLLTQLQVENPDGLIRPGSYAQVRFPSITKPPQLTLPSNSLIFRTEGLQVAVVKDDKTIEMRKVEVGRDYGPIVEIRSGLTATDKVVASPFDSLVNGMTVRVQEKEDKGPAEKKG